MSNNNWRKSLSYLEDSDLKISTKEGKKERKLVPPKIKGKHFTNVEFLLNAEFVWLTPKTYPSLSYDRTRDDSYFEQCYRTCGKLGEGSFGSVIKVKSLEDGQLYAMKISKEPFKGEYDRKLKLREVQHHEELSSHPNIISLHKAWEEDRYVFMQFELCRPIACWDDCTPMSEDGCWDLLADILQALQHIHSSGRAHFDVKVDNILMGDDNMYKLSDFGLMLTLGEDTEAIREGDAKYVAPELVLGGISKFTPKADIYSLGITVLELAGNLELPIRGNIWCALRKDTFPFEQTKHLSDELFHLLMSMMSSDPDKRPSAHEILAFPKLKEVVSQRKNMKFQNFMALYNYPSVETMITFFVSFAWAIAVTMLYLVAKVRVASMDSQVTPNFGSTIDFESSETEFDSAFSTSKGTSAYTSGNSPSCSSDAEPAHTSGNSPSCSKDAEPAHTFGNSPSCSKDATFGNSPSCSKDAERAHTSRNSPGCSKDAEPAHTSGNSPSCSKDAVPAAFFSSTPMETNAMIDKANLLASRIRRLIDEQNESGVEISGSSGIMSPRSPSPPPRDIHCDWVSLTSPDREIRQRYVNRRIVHCPSQSLLQYGISPIRLSQACKRQIQAKKQRWENRDSTRKVSRVLFFGPDLPEPGCSQDKQEARPKRQKIMAPRNLALTFDEESSSEDESS